MIMNKLYRGSLILALVTALISPAQSHATVTAPVDSTQPTQQSIAVDIPAILSGNSYLATPQELRDLGFDEQTIQAQQSAIGSIPTPAKIKNLQTLSSQQKITQDIRTRSDEVPYNQLNRYNTVASSLRSTYQVRTDRGALLQYANKGVFDVNISGVMSLSPGRSKARSLYRPPMTPLPSALSWTVWRENTNQEFYFAPTVSNYGHNVYPTVVKIERYALG